jgi:hypothetical protein
MSGNELDRVFKDGIEAYKSAHQRNPEEPLVRAKIGLVAEKFKEYLQEQQEIEDKQGEEIRPTTQTFILPLFQGEKTIILEGRNLSFAHRIGMFAAALVIAATAYPVGESPNQEMLMGEFLNTGISGKRRIERSEFEAGERLANALVDYFEEKKSPNVAFRGRVIDTLRAFTGFDGPDINTPAKLPTSRPPGTRREQLQQPIAESVPVRVGPAVVVRR